MTLAKILFGDVFGQVSNGEIALIPSSGNYEVAYIKGVVVIWRGGIDVCIVPVKRSLRVALMKALDDYCACKF